MFGHDKVDVYRLAIQYTAWAFRLARKLPNAYRHARDQLLRASQSIPLNIAEGNGRVKELDRRHFFDIARGSALECAATQDVLEVCGGINSKESLEGKDMLDRIVAMLVKMGGPGSMVNEDVPDYADVSE